LVCTVWSAAAATATTAINVVLDSNHCHDGSNLSAWLQKHGQQVTSIRAVNPSNQGHDNYYVKELVLPCRQLPKLQSLVLEGLCITLDDTGVAAQVERSQSPSSPKQEPAAGALLCPDPQPEVSAATAGAGALLPRLQELEIRSGYVMPCLNPLVLASIPSLKKLVLEHSTGWCGEAFSLSWQGSLHLSFSARILQQLTGLTGLQLSCTESLLGLQGNALEAVSALQHLQRLTVMVQLGLDFDVLGRLPSSIIALELSGDMHGVEDATVAADQYGNVWPHVAHVPILQGLTGLQHLVLRDLLIDPSRLEPLHITPLTFLQLAMVVNRPAEDGTALLAALQQLTGLKHLALRGNFWGSLLAPQQFSALVAASGLTALHIWGRGDQPLPCRALRRMLRAGKLPQLQVLRLDCKILNQHQAPDRFTGCVRASDLCLLAKRCPALQQLSLLHVVRHTDAYWVGIILHLPQSLRALSLAGRALDDAAAKGVAQLTALQDLKLTDSPVTEAGLQHLTALQRLTRLECCLQLAG
jgi:hypothetical protein